jgi:GR25 family glycosyltransferase involved in LPS biosynthesis
MSYQFIIISATEERKQKMEEQFAVLELKTQINKHYLEASLISNSTEYLKGYSDESKFKYICCARSHFRAIEYAANSCDKFDFSIILEDDVAFYKENFLEMINEIIENWSHYGDRKMVSIGWIPCDMNYNTFLNRKKMNLNFEAKPDTKIIIDLYCPGLQGYIVNNNDMIPYVKVLIHPTFIDLRNKLNTIQYLTLMLDKLGVPRGRHDEFTSIDVFLNIILKQLIVFPPLLIEQDIPSLLGHKNKENYWDIYFKNHEIEKSKYNFF